MSDLTEAANLAMDAAEALERCRWILKRVMPSNPSQENPILNWHACVSGLATSAERIARQMLNANGQ